ncbi:hypothetical protein HED63_25105 [Ochrobactrum cytisi]|nr:hypothetical protein [Brucella cytisi]
MAFVTAILIALVLIKSPGNTVKPIAIIEFGTDDDALLIEAATVRDALFAALGNFHTLSLRSNSDTYFSKDDDIRKFVIGIKYRADNQMRELWWQVRDELQNEVLGSGVVRTDGTRMTRTGIAENLASSLAPTLAASNGVVNVQLVREGSDHSSLGNTCVLKAELLRQVSGQSLKFRSASKKRSPRTRKIVTHWLLFLAFYLALQKLYRIQKYWPEVSLSRSVLFCFLPGPIEHTLR